MRRSAAGVPVVENDIYGELAITGEPLPRLKQLDRRGGTVLLRSFSKVSFPGLRVGWVIGPKPSSPACAELKQSPICTPISFHRRSCWSLPNRAVWPRTGRE